MDRFGRNLGIATACGLAAVVSCSSEQTRVETVDVDARIAWVRARFGVGRPVASGFERANGALVATIPGPERQRTMRAATTRLPLHGDGRVEIEDDTSHLRVSFALRGATDVAAQAAGGFVVYPGALPSGADLIHRSDAAGTEDHVYFASRPETEELVYDVDVSHIAGLRLSSGALEMLDQAGTPRLRVAPPYVVDAHERRHEASLSVTGCAYDTSSAGPWGRPVTAPSASHCTVRVTWGGVDYPALVDPVWSSTGTLTKRRAQHAMALLPSGRVLVVGGAGGVFSGTAGVTAELFDVATGTFSATGGDADPLVGRPTITVLGTGKALIVGTQPSAPAAPRHGYAALFDPAAGTITRILTPLIDDLPRIGHGAALLKNGEVLVVGGGGPPTLYDPTTNAFRATAGAMTVARTDLRALTLASGRVLVVGRGAGDPDPFGADVYRPATEDFQHLAFTLPTVAWVDEALLLTTGEPLVLGSQGDAATAGTKTVAFRFDELTATFKPQGAPASIGHGFASSALASGAALLTGGREGSATQLASIVDANGIRAIEPMTTVREDHASVRLADSRVLVTGGIMAGGFSAITAAETLTAIPTTRPCDTANPSSCETGFCVDGVCCDTSCEGQCEACDVAGHVGTCTPVTGPVHLAAKNSVERSACPGDKSSCDATCDGVERKRCNFPTAAVPCGTKCTDANLESNVCNGAGGCISQAARACDAHLTCADASMCRTSCVTRSDCVAGFACAADGTCQPSAQCSDRTTSQSPGGGEQSCIPYACDTNGDHGCLTQCDSVSDCAPSFACDPVGACVPVPVDSSTSCSASPHSHTASFGWVMVLLASCGILRRRVSR